MNERFEPQQFLTIGLDEMKNAAELMDSALNGGDTHTSSWTVERGETYEQFYLSQGATSQGYRCLLGAKVEGSDDDKPINITRYSLDLGSGHFIVVPERHDNIDSFDEADEDEGGEADSMLLQMGMFCPTESDWDDFKAIMEAGKDRAKARLDRELAQLLGSAALEPEAEPDTL